VALLARHATGSFRDALGTLEQLVTYTGTDIATDDVLAVLGVADVDLLFEAFDAVASGDARAAWLAAARLADTGRDIAQFLKDLEAHARDLLVVQTLGEVPHELRLTPDRDERLAEQAGRIPGSSLVRLLDLLAEALRTVKDGADARTRLEAALVKAAAPEVDPAARALMARVERLEAALGGASAPAQPPPAVEPPRAVEPLRAAEEPRTVDPPRAVPEQPTPEPQRGEAQPEPQSAEAQPAAPAPAPPSPPSTTQGPDHTPGEAAGDAPDHTPGEGAGHVPDHTAGEGAGHAPEHAPTEAAGRPPEHAPTEAAGRPPEHAPTEAAGRAPEPAQHAAPTPTATALVEPDLDAVRTLWPAVLDAVRADNGLLAACLAEAHPVEVRGSEVVVAFAEHDTFNRKMADGREHRATVDDALRGLAGSSLRVVFELRELEERSEAKPPSEDELVARFKTEFDAEEIVPDDPQPDEPGGQN